MAKLQRALTELVDTSSAFHSCSTFLTCRPLIYKRASISCSQMSITVCHYHFKTLSILCTFCCCHHLFAHSCHISCADTAFALRLSLPSAYPPPLMHRLEKRHFLPHLGPNPAGSEDAQFAPALEFYTHFKHNRESCGNLLQFLVLPLAYFTHLF